MQAVVEDGESFTNHSIRWRLLDKLLEHETEIISKWFVPRKRGAVIFTFASHDDIRRFLAASASSSRAHLPENSVFVSQRDLLRKANLSGTTTNWKREFTQYAAQVGLLIVRVENSTHAISTTPVPQNRRLACKLFEDVPFVLLFFLDYITVSSDVNCKCTPEPIRRDYGHVVLCARW